MALADSIIDAESGGRQDIGNPRSSAYGPGQFLKSTWLQMIAKYRPDLLKDHDERELLALRADPALSRQMTNAYADENAAHLRRNGIADTPGNTYLAHFAGPGGAVKLFQGNPDTLASETLGPQVAAANPFLKGMSNADLIAWAKQKMGHEPLAPPRSPMPIPNVPAQSVPQQAAPAAPEQAALPQAAQPAAGMLPPAVLAQLAGAGQGMAPQGPQAQMAPQPQPGGPMMPAPSPTNAPDPQISGMLSNLMKQILASPMGGDQAAVMRQQSFGG